MTSFVIFNWLFCILTLFLIFLVIWRYRFLMVKPSVIVITFFHLRIQWAATFKAEYIEQFLPDPIIFLFLVQILPILGLIGSFFIFHKDTIAIFSRVSKKNLLTFSVKKEIIFIPIFIILLIAIYYFMFIPPEKTGLYAIFFDPSKAVEAREASLKLIDFPLLRYGYSFLINVFAPFLSVFLIFVFLKYIKRIHFMSLLAASMLALVLVLVSLPGARTPAAALIMTMIWALYLHKGIPFRPIHIILGLLAVFSIPVILTIFREGQVVDFSRFINYLKGGIFYRVFVVPMEVGLYHVHYAQVNGFFGIAAIPKLAALFNIEPVNAANLIYTYYYQFSIMIPTGLANTSFIFSYFSYFGIFSIVISLLGLWMLDLAVLVFRKIRNDWILLAAIASLFPASMSFLSADYTIVLVTNGFILLLLLAWILDRINTFFNHEDQKD